MSFRPRAGTLTAASLSAAMMLGLLTPRVGIAQKMVMAQIQPPVQDDTLAAKDSNSGVYVRDSAIALEKMDLAQRLERMNDWAKSADVYQEIMDKYRDRVVPSHADDNGVIDQYTSVISKVTEHLRAWPEAGLNVYRARYEVTAQNLMKTAKHGDLRPLHEVFTRYFVTESGKQAGMSLVDAYLELGEFPAAEWIGQQLLLHPTLTTERPGVLFRVGLAAHLCGDEKTAQNVLAELKNKFPAALGMARGKDVVLADELAQDLTRVQSESYTAAGDSWVMPGGDPSRSRISPSVARPGAKLYGIELAQPNYKQVADIHQRQALQSEDKTAREEGAALGIMPAIDRGEMFFQDNAHLSAVSLDSGVPLAGWAATYPGRNGQYTIADAFVMPSSHSFSVTLTDTAVLAVMDQNDTQAVMNGLPERQERLVCLDRETGKELWTVNAHGLPDTNLKMLKIGGSPLVVGDNVYIVGRAAKGNGYEDCYVLCFDLVNGVYRWSCYVSSAANTSGVMNVNGQMIVSDTSTHLSYDSGRLFVSTNLGAVAALDAYNGTIAWLNIYRESDEAMNPNAMQMNMGFNPMGMGMGAPSQSSTPPMPWAENAPLISGGNVFILPSDGKYLLIYDAGTGQLIKKMRKDVCCRIPDDAGNSPAVLPTDTKLTEPITLLGVVPNALLKDRDVVKQVDLLILGTPSRIVAIRWRDYNDDKPSKSFAFIDYLWLRDQPTHSVRGRGFVTADSIYIPTVWALCRITIENGRLDDTYPPHNTVWADDEGPGNVVSSGDHLVIAGDKRINVYTDLSIAKDKLAKAVADDPTDPDARLRYAEVMFVAGQHDLAIQKLDEAIGLLGGLSSLRPGPARDRAFNDALTFATKLTHAGADKVKVVDGLFDRAGAAAYSPSQQVSYRMSRAHFAARAVVSGQEQDLPLAIKLYQEILANDAMRTVPVPEEKQEADAAAGSDDASDSEGMTQAALIAEADIREIIQGPKGRAAYAPYEQQAKADMDAAAAAKDPNKLLAVATAYPNAKVATESMIKAADAFEPAGQPRAATQVLRQIYLKLDDKDARKIMVLEAMARNYLKTGRTEAAASRLAQGAALAVTLSPNAMLSQPMTLPDGTVLNNLSLVNARDQVRAFIGKEAAANLPDFGFPSHATAHAYYKMPHQTRRLDPLADDAGAEILNVGKLMVPVPAFSRNDRVVTWTAGAGLSLYLPVKNQPLGTVADFSDEPRGVAWTAGNNPDLLAWSASSLSLISGADAKSHWKMDLSALPTLDVMAQATPDIVVPAQNTNAEMMRRQQIMMLQMRGNFRGQVMVNGQIINPAVAPGAVAPAPADVPAAAGEIVTDVHPLSDLAIVATSTGRVLAVDLVRGSVLWQTRVSGRAVDRLVNNDDFTVLKTTDDNTVQLIVLDTFSGRLLARKAFSAELGMVPINLALADDGTLAYTMNDRLIIHDLYESGHDRRLEQGKTQDPLPQAPQLFARMSQPDQLLIHGGQVLALSDGGKYIRGYNAETAQLRDYRSVDDKEPQMVPMILTTGGGGPDTGLRLAGDYVFAWGTAGVAAYNINRPDINWTNTNPPKNTAGMAHELCLGQDYVLMLSEAAGTNGPAAADVQPQAPQPVGVIQQQPGLRIIVGGGVMQPAPAQAPPAAGNGVSRDKAVAPGPNSADCLIWAYSRAMLTNKTFPWESGTFDYQREVRDPAGILTWQPVDGGLYYLSGDHHLHLLKGTRDIFTAATQPTTQP